MRTVQRCPQCGWTGTLGKRSSPKGLVLYSPPRVTSSKTGTNAPRPWKGSGGLWGGGNRRPHDTGSILDTGNILLLDLSAGYIGCSVCADSSICTFGCIFIYVYCILINIIKKEPNKYKTSRIRIYQCILDGCGFGIKYHVQKTLPWPETTTLFSLMLSSSTFMVHFCFGCCLNCMTLWISLYRSSLKEKMAPCITNKCVMMHLISPLLLENSFHYLENNKIQTTG